MKIRGSSCIAALTLALVGLPVSASAQAAKTPPSKAQMETVSLRFRVLVSALQSDKVEQPVKNVLFSCIYSNSMAKISEGMDKAIAANKQVKVDTSNPTQLLGIMAGVCGYRPAKPTGAGR